ncbi:MAG: hypothetical protein KHX03_04850 [Clostridium sp.]|nr:hypothetical protein [Clostridium sp.]
MEKKFKLKGHIIDSLILSKVLDKIEALGIDCYAADVKVGARRNDFSEAVFIVETDDESKMEEAVKLAKMHGAVEI